MTKRFFLVGATMMAMALAACGGTDTTIASSGASAGPGGAGGADVTATASSATGATATSSATGTGGDGGSGGSAATTIGTVDCAGPTTPIAPIVGDLDDANGNPIDENGAIALLEVDVPAGFVASSWSYPLVKLGICGAVNTEAVAFVAPTSINGPPAQPANAQVVPVLGAGLKFISGLAIVTVDISPPLEPKAGEALWIGVKLHGVKGSRACVRACDGGGPDPQSFFSALNANAMVDDCPANNCVFKPLAVSPDPVAAQQYGNDDRAWSYSVTGSIPTP